MTTVRNIEIMQECERGFTLDVVKKFVSDYENIDKYLYILHDKDNTRSHIHLLLKFKNPQNVESLVNKFNGIIAIEHLEKIKKWSSAVAYLIHAKQLDKYQYDVSEIVSNYDFNNDIAVGSSSIKDDELNIILNRIEKGEIKRYNVELMLSCSQYVKYKARIQDAFNYCDRRFLLLNPLREFKVFYFFGDTGTGKSRYCYEFAKRENLSIFFSSSSNDILDSYLGQEILVLDDVRPEQFCYSDLLKLLDPKNNSSYRSRYNNKYLIYTKYIILTSPYSLKDFVKHLGVDKFDSVNQLFRRISFVYEFTYDNIFIKKRDKLDFVQLKTLDNIYSEDLLSLPFDK